MSNILDRITQIADLEKITISKIEQKIGASKGVLYKAIQKNTDIQSKWIVLIVENFPQYNPNWLLTGKGEPLLSCNQKTQEVSDSKISDEKTINKIDDMYNKINYMYNLSLKGEVSTQLESLKEIIEASEEKVKQSVK